MNRRARGAEKESLAAAYLERQGMQVVMRNYRNRQGEIDIIGYHQGYLVFVEVKYRAGTDKCYAAEAVGIRKQRQVCRVADYYRLTHHVDSQAGVRYDVVAIQGGEIHWIRNAFPHVGR